MQPPDKTEQTIPTPMAQQEAFRLNAKQLFLTYSHCLIPKERVLELLEEKLGDIVEYVVASEKHKSGQPHIHCYIKLPRKINVRNASFFDLLDPMTGLTVIAKHPESAYQGCRSPKAVWDYCIKDGKYVTNMQAPPHKNNVYAEALDRAKSGDVIGAMAHLRKGDPRSFSHNKKKLLETMREERTKFPFVKHQLSEYPAWNPDWWDKNNRTLFLIGEAGAGKTELSKALLPKGCYTMGTEGLKLLDEYSHEGVIFDDVSIADKELQEQIHILDLFNESMIRILYCSVILPRGFPRIFTSHLPDIMQMANFMDPAVRRRCNMVRVISPTEMELVDLDQLIAEQGPIDLFAQMAQRRRGGIGRGKARFFM